MVKIQATFYYSRQLFLIHCNQCICLWWWGGWGGWGRWGRWCIYMGTIREKCHLDIKCEEICCPQDQLWCNILHPIDWFGVLGHPLTLAFSDAQISAFKTTPFEVPNNPCHTQELFNFIQSCWPKSEGWIQAKNWRSLQPSGTFSQRLKFTVGPTDYGLFIPSMVEWLNWVLAIEVLYFSLYSLSG